jgi:hypothetical protein
MVELQVQQQFGQIGLKITPLQFNLDIRPADIEIHQRPAKITIEQPAATLEIDNTPARESLGYYGMAEQQRILVQEAQAACAEGITRRVLIGEQCANLSNKESLAKIVTKAAEPQQKRLQIVSSQPIQITVTPHPVEFNVNLGGVSADVTSGSVQGELQYGSVQVFMEQNPYIQIRAVGSIYDGQK